MTWIISSARTILLPTVFMSHIFKGIKFLKSCDIFNHWGTICIAIEHASITVKLCRICKHSCVFHAQILCKMETFHALHIVLLISWKNTLQKNVSSVATFLILAQLRFQISIYATLDIGEISNFW